MRDPEGRTAGQFAGAAVVGPAALLVAASCGFRGGRVLPAAPVGAALGLCAHAPVPAVQPAVGVADSVPGMLLAVTRQGRVSLFTAAVLALLCIASRPVTGRPRTPLRADGTAMR